MEGQSTILIHDLKQSPVAIVPLGSARISHKHIRILHKIDLLKIEETLHNLRVEAEQKIINDHTLSPLIQVKIAKLYETFWKIKPQATNRVKRWESIGKAWKYISGSPDADDLRIINFTTNSLIDQNDKQIQINRDFEDRINKITKSINSIMANINTLTTKTLEGFDSVSFLFNLDELSHQLEIIEQAISLARLSIPSSRLISLQELAAARRSLQDSGLQADTVDNVLDIASAYVMHSPRSIVYVLKVPRITNEIFTLYYVEPIISNDTRIQLNSRYFLKGLSLFSSKTLCPKTRNLHICANENLEAPTMCIEQLFEGRSSQCIMEKTYGHNFVKRIDNFNIIVNDANMTINSNCSAHDQQLQGSYLIQISNCSIKLDNEEYANSDMEIPSNLFIPTTGLKVTSIKLINRMPLEYLQELHQQQRDHINHLNLTTENFHGSLHLLKWISFGSLSLTPIIAIALVVVWIFKTRIPSRATIVITEEKLQKDDQRPEPETTTTYPKVILVPQV